MPKSLKLKLACLLMITSVLMTGCWDKVEIERRAFVLTIGIDKANEPGSKLQVVFGIPNLKTYISTPMSGGGKGPAKFDLVGKGDSIFDIARTMETRLNDVLYFGHTKAVIFGESILKDPYLFRQVLDELERYHEFSRKVNVVYVKSDAIKVIKMSPELEPILGVYINEVFQNIKITPKISTGDIGKIIEQFHNTGGNGVIPLLSVAKKDVSIAGSEIVKKYRGIGEITAQDNTYLEMILKQMQGGSLVIKRDNVNVPIQIYSVRTTRRVAIDGGKIYFIINITIEGDISGDIQGRNNEVMTETFMKQLQSMAENSVKEGVMHTIDKLKNYKVDVIGVGDLMSKYYPDEWDKIRNKWDDSYFSDINVVVHPKVFLRRNGLIR